MSNYEPAMILNAHGIELPEEEEKVRYVVVDDDPNEPFEYGWRVMDFGPDYETSGMEAEETVATVARCSTEDSATLVCFALNLLNAAQKRANARGNP